MRSMLQFEIFHGTQTEWDSQLEMIQDGIIHIFETRPELARAWILAGQGIDGNEIFPQQAPVEQQMVRSKSQPNLRPNSNQSQSPSSTTPFL